LRAHQKGKRCFSQRTSLFLILGLHRLIAIDVATFQIWEEKVTEASALSANCNRNVE